MDNDLVATWMGVFVGALGVLFTIGAIVVTAVLFRQSREYRDLIDRTMQGYRDAFAALEAEYRSRFDQLAKATRLEMENDRAALASATGERHKELEERIGRAQETLKRIQASTSSPGYGPTHMTSLSFPRLVLNPLPVITCANCGSKYSPPETTSSFVSLIESKSKCPYCGHENVKP